MVVLAVAIGCMRATATMEGAPINPQQPGAVPRLLVFITVDQLRGDMLDRYRGDLSRGYATLMRGAWFVNAYQDHAITETAPGHASTLSGRFPRSTGIMENSAGVGDSRYPLLASTRELGASPDRFQGTTLFDWLVAKDRRSRALSVSRKDRGAILTIGRSKQDVYWYSGTGNFTTSTFYRDTLPTWVTEFNAQRIPQSYAGKQWTLSRPLSTYPEPDTVPEENSGRSFFPFQLPTDSTRAAAAFASFPGIDSLTALFALRGVRALELGMGPQTDILAVSFSATDAIGHTFGPDSREAHENEIRLDETIGWFMDSLFAMRPRNTILFALTADHGVQPIPALARRRGEARDDEAVIVPPVHEVVAATKARIAAAGGDSSAFLFDAPLVGIQRQKLGGAGPTGGRPLNADSILTEFRKEALLVRGVARVDWMRDIRKADFAVDPIARRWNNHVGDNPNVDLVITLTRYSYWYRATATHGSPYDQDAHVPIIFYGPWVKPGRYTEFARTVDIAPTLAQILRVRPTEKLDGVVLMNAILR
jgi:predicted AlkP superfamily pyrophosphatase or phosphodiesterase